MENNIYPIIVIYGAGAIGTSIAGLISPHYSRLYLLARGENAKVMKQNGLILYQKENDNPNPIKVNIIEDLNEVPSVDFVLITVKNYDLEEVAKNISEKLGDKPVIVGLQNGIENQKILPKYFSKVLYCVIMFSAWKEKSGLFGYKEKGQLILGALDNRNFEFMSPLKEILKVEFNIKQTDKLQDAIHSKLIVNLANSVLTLINVENQDDATIGKIKKIFFKAWSEGVDIVEAEGYKEFRLRGIPWKTIKSMAEMPPDKGIEAFKEQLKYAKLNSMAQDMLIHQRNKSELESLVGYFIKLADKHGLKAPYNRTIYLLCKEHFAKQPYEPLDVDIVWNKINEKLI